MPVDHRISRYYLSAGQPPANRRPTFQHTDMDRPCRVHPHHLQRILQQRLLAAFLQNRQYRGL